MRQVPAGLPLGASAGDVPVWTGSGWSTKRALDSVNGMLGQSMSLDAAVISNSGVLVSGTRYIMRIPIAVTAASAVRTIWTIVSTAGATLTAGQSLVAVYDSTGVQVGSTSADQSGVWTSTGVKSATVGSFAVTSGTDILVELLSVGTTPPTFRGTSGGLGLLANLTASQVRQTTDGTGQTTVSASLTPGSFPTNVALHAWVGIT